MSRDATVVCARSVDEVLDLLAGRPDDSKIIAGGTAFTLLWRAGLIHAEQLISCSTVRGLDAIGTRGDRVVLGALATFRDAEVSGVVRARLPVLASALGHVGNLRVRNAATWGGNLAEADNTSDLPAILLALDAEVLVRSATGERASGVGDLIVDFFETTLGPEEMITELRIPIPNERYGGSYVKFVSRSAEDRTCLGVAAFADVDDDGVCRDLRVAAVGAAPVPLRLPEVEARARGERLDLPRMREIAAAYAERADPLSDLRGSAEYRRAVLPGLVVEALTRAVARENAAVLL